MRDLNKLDKHGRKVAESYSKYMVMLESNTGSDIIPKHVALQMLTTLSNSIISMYKSTRNVSIFISMSSSSAGTAIIQHVSSSTTKEPATYACIPPGKVRSTLSVTVSHAPSVITNTSKAMSPAEIRRTRQCKATARTPASALRVLD